MRSMLAGPLLLSAVPSTLAAAARDVHYPAVLIPADFACACEQVDSSSMTEANVIDSGWTKEILATDFQGGQPTAMGKYIAEADFALTHSYRKTYSRRPLNLVPSEPTDTCLDITGRGYRV